jgi:hypothetical protein
MAYGYIYKTTDIKTGKVYIGQHKQSIFDTKYKGSGNIIKKIIKKRPQDLITELLEWCDTLDELNLAEIKYIAEYKSQDRRFGYNVEAGGLNASPTEEQKQLISETLKTKYQTGEVIHPRLGKPVSQETRNKISKTLTGRKNRPRTDEEKRKISENNKGKHDYLRDYRLTEDMKKMLSQKYKGRKLHDVWRKHISESLKGKNNNASSKKVYQFTLDGVFIKEWPSASECSRAGFTRESVCKCCRNEMKKHKGYRWSYNKILNDNKND